jgi:hypothetical protein
MAGFEVTPYGRFCLTPEVWHRVHEDMHQTPYRRMMAHAQQNHVTNQRKRNGYFAP